MVRAVRMRLHGQCTAGSAGHGPGTAGSAGHGPGTAGL